MDDETAASNSESIHEQLVAIMTDWTAAIVSNNAVRIGGFMHDDWVIVSGTGIADKETFLSIVASGELTHSAMDLVSAARTRVYGETAVFTARLTNTAHYRDQRFDADEWTSDVFVKHHGRWQCVLTHITAVSPDD